MLVSSQLANSLPLLRKLPAQTIVGSLFLLCPKWLNCGMGELLDSCAVTVILLCRSYLSEGDFIKINFQLFSVGGVGYIYVYLNWCFLQI